MEADFDDGATIGFTFADVAAGGDLSAQDFSGATEQDMIICNSLYWYCLSASFATANEVEPYFGDSSVAAAITDATVDTDCTLGTGGRMSYEDGYWGWAANYGFVPYTAATGLWESEGDELSWIRFIKNTPDAAAGEDDDGDANIFWGIDTQGATSTDAELYSDDAAVTLVAAGAAVLAAAAL